MEQITRNIIGKRINAALAKENVMQKELAQKLGVSDNVVSYWCSGTRTPNVEQLIEISKILNVPTDFLLGRVSTYSKDKNISAVGKITGLKDNAINDLLGNFSTLDIVNYLLEEDYLKRRSADPFSDQHRDSSLLELIATYFDTKPTETELYIDRFGKLTNSPAGDCYITAVQSQDLIDRVLLDKIIDRLKAGKTAFEGGNVQQWQR